MGTDAREGIATPPQGKRENAGRIRGGSHVSHYSPSLGFCQHQTRFKLTFHAQKQLPAVPMQHPIRRLTHRAPHGNSFLALAMVFRRVSIHLRCMIWSVRTSPQPRHRRFSARSPRLNRAWIGAPQRQVGASICSSSQAWQYW